MLAVNCSARRNYLRDNRVFDVVRTRERVNVCRLPNARFGNFQAYSSSYVGSSVTALADRSFPRQHKRVEAGARVVRRHVVRQYVVLGVVCFGGEREDVVW